MRASSNPGPALIFAVCIGVSAGGGTVLAASGGAGAKFDKPVSLTIDGGTCESDGKGSIGANFGSALAFDMGPAVIAPPGLNMSRAPYKGPGTYREVIISGYPAKGVVFLDLGTIVVNADRHSGTFATDDGKAAGSWDCGEPLE
jgi:hypothetical protein